MQYQKSKGNVSLSGQRGFARGLFGQGAGRRNGLTPVAGDIISADANSITVKLMDGSSKIIILSSTTTIQKTDTATKADLKTGQRVAVFGTTNTDGSVTAQNVQLNPQMRGMGGKKM